MLSSCQIYGSCKKLSVLIVACHIRVGSMHEYKTINVDLKPTHLIKWINLSILIQTNFVLNLQMAISQF